MIAEMTYYQILEYFLIYSFVGWCVEVIYQAIAKGLVVNRGFLNGPVCPIYGFGVVAIFALINVAGTKEMHEVNALGVFVGGVILATLIELIGGWALDKIFHARWWDYSNKPFNFHGYICLEFSLIWGLGILIVVRAVHPMIADTASHIPEKYGWIIMAVLYAIYLADFILSVLCMAGLNKKMAELDKLRADMRVVSDGLSKRLGEGALDTAEHVDEAKVQAALARADIKEQVAEAREDVREGRALSKAEYEARKASTRDEFEAKRAELAERIRGSRHFGTGRLLRAFPDMEHRDYKELLEQFKNMN